jgi:hypothetical protein
MEYKAEDYVTFIESGRHDKISPNALEIIAKRFRELENEIKEEKFESSDTILTPLQSFIVFTISCVAAIAMIIWLVF